MKSIYKITIALLVSSIFFACEEQEIPTAEGSILDFEVPDTPPTVDYLVGAHYSKFNWSVNLYEAPAIGQYDAFVGDNEVYDQHIQWADQGGIDFFIFQMRSAVNQVSFSEDSTFIDNLLGAENAASKNFAINYNFAEMEISGTNRIDVEANLLDRMVSDFIAMGDFFLEANYQTTSSGNPIVYIDNADALFADNYQNVFDTIRTAVRNQLEVNLYLIAEQQPWTPPMRFESKFKGGVDAISHSTYAQINASANAYDYDRYINFEQYVDLALSFSSQELTKIDIEYIPQIAPSFDMAIQNPASSFFEIQKEEEWFRTYCDIAKRASSNNSNNIIILNSFNSWNMNTQIEPAESYGVEFLDILRDEFKQ